MSVCCEYCVLSGRGLCDELITRPEESYRLLCAVVCDLETSRMRMPWPTVGCSTKNKQKTDKRYTQTRHTTVAEGYGPFKNHLLGLCVCVYACVPRGLIPIRRKSRKIGTTALRWVITKVRKPNTEFTNDESTYFHMIESGFFKYTQLSKCKSKVLQLEYLYIQQQVPQNTIILIAHNHQHPSMATCFGLFYTIFRPIFSCRRYNLCALYEGWNFNSGNYLFTTDTK